MNNTIIMEPDQFQILLQTIKDTTETTVKATVNGKIDRMQTQLNNYIKEDTEWKETYKEEDDRWKEEVKPHIEVMRQTQNFVTGLIWVLKFVGILGGAVAILYAFLKYLHG